MHIGIVPYELRKTKKLGQLLVDQLIWPLDKPSNSLHVKDLGENDHIVIFPYSKTILTANTKVTCKVSLIILNQERYMEGTLI